MSRRFTPYLFAGLLGVMSGVYIFRPVFDRTVATQETRGATNAAPEPTKQPQPASAAQEGN